MSRDAVKVWVNGQVVVSVAAGCTENVQEVTGEEGESPGWTGSLDLPAGWHTLKVLSSKHVGPDGLELRCLELSSQQQLMCGIWQVVRARHQEATHSCEPSVLFSCAILSGEAG